MKNAFKLSVLALGISVSIGACKGQKSSDVADSTKVDSSTIVKSSSDTSLKIDTVKKATDTSDMKTDTVSKTITKKTESKKTLVKKKHE